MEKENRNLKQFQEMRITIDGIEYKAVDSKIKEGMDIGCRDCDIYKARIPRSPGELPLCFEPGVCKARLSCRSRAAEGYQRIFKKVKK